MYCLWNRQTRSDTKVIARLLLKDQYPHISPIQRHEVAFVIGQLNPLSKSWEIWSILEKSISDKTEFAVAWHESIIAYGSIYHDKKAIQFLKQMS